MDEAKFRATVAKVLEKVKAEDPALGPAAVERLGFEIVGFMTNQAYETREIVLKKMRDMSDKLSQESERDYDEAMLKAHGIGEAFFDIYSLGEDEIGIPLGVFKKR